MTINNLDIHDVAKYIGLSLITKEMTVSHLKLQKLLYYSQAWFMVFLGRDNTLFHDIPQAWVNGPVYPVIYEEYKSKAQNMCDHLNASDFYAGNPIDGFATVSARLGFDASQVELMESIVTLYGAKTQNQLIFMTHAEQPWAEARSGLMPFEYSQREISLDLMYNYYKARYDHNRAAQ